MLKTQRFALAIAALLLLGVTITFSLVSYRQTMAQFHHWLDSLANTYEIDFKEKIQNRNHQLIALADTIGLTHQDRSMENGNGDALGSTAQWLSSRWSNLQIVWGVEHVALLDSHLNPVFSSTDKLPDAASALLEAALEREHPLMGVDCIDICYMLQVVPLFNGADIDGMLLLKVPLADAFVNFSSYHDIKVTLEETRYTDRHYAIVGKGDLTEARFQVPFHVNEDGTRYHALITKNIADQQQALNRGLYQNAIISVIILAITGYLTITIFMQSLQRRLLETAKDLSTKENIIDEYVNILHFNRAGVISDMSCALRRALKLDQRKDNWPSFEGQFCSQLSEPTLAALWRTVEAGEEWEGDFTVSIDMDAPIHFRAVIVKGESEDAAVYYSAILRDITDHIEAELARDAAEEAMLLAEGASQAKGEFLATISHEIRTPLNGVIGMSELLEETSLDVDQAQYNDTIRLSARVLLNIINDVLDFSKIEAGKMDLEVFPFKIISLLDECMSLFAVRTNETGISLYASIGERVPTVVAGDMVKIRQVLTNFLSNAFKFTERGHILLEIDVDDELETSEGEYGLRFRVSDTGLGLKPEQQQKLFAAFVQADASITRKHGGTGLGLAISKRMAELMGGGIGLESVYGQGATFWFSAKVNALPYANDGLARPREIRHVEDCCGFVLTESELQYHHVASVLYHVGFISSVNWVREETDSFTLQEQDFLIVDCDYPSSQANAEAYCRSHAHTHVISLSGLDKPIESATFETSLWVSMSKPITAKVLFGLLDDFYEKQISEPDSERRPQSVNVSALKVLVAEDNPVNKMVIKGLLSKLGVEPILAEDGERALNFFQQQHRDIDLILMDCEMPVMDGCAATRAIREFQESQALRRVPIVGLSGHALSTHREQALAAGMDDYLTKPIEFKKLEEKLIEVARQMHEGADK